MLETTTNHHSRFFSQLPGSKDSFEITPKQDENTVPFGLQFQEDFPQAQLEKNAGATMGPSITNTPSGSDNCIDVDYEL